ncbi:hypothetical protein QVD17_13224 [Tagetes erecta]|uniref:Late embryogenesis abundant protein LEA-2 subgroup domain-containing protein n=1 Tax=Tagetes erecta TaxID=13708 RepID=A0AAD8KVU5_TARER|nr:hypothetical protein QVD17_13224 [Tagetes erecta]
MSAEHVPDENKDALAIGCACALIVFLLTVVPIYFFPGSTPDITLHDVKLYTFNVSNQSISSNLQITFFCQNTDDDGIYFDKVDVYALYMSRLQITPTTTIYPTYLDHGDSMLWLLRFNETEVAVNDPDLAMVLAQDVINGAVMINVKATGQLRYKNKVWSFDMKVNCPVYVTFGNKTDDHGNVDPFAKGCDISV